jgi:hypothetical protein
MRRVGVRLLADRLKVVNVRLCRQQEEMMSRQGVRVSVQDLQLGCDFPSGRVDLRLPSLPSDVRKIVSPAGRFLMWLCRRRFFSALEAVFMETTTERPMFFSMACVVTWIRCRFSFASQEDDG